MNNYNVLIDKDTSKFLGVSIVRRVAWPFCMSANLRFHCTKFPIEGYMSAPPSACFIMASEVIDICCIKCNVVTCNSNNDWRQLGAASLIAPVQELSYKIINVAKDQVFLQLKFVPEDLHGKIVCEASCGQCGNVLGQGFRDSEDVDSALERWAAIYCSLRLADLWEGN